FQKVTGCIYLDTCNPASRFDEDHLQLVAAIAGTSAVAIENARRMHWLEQENLRLSAEINLDHNLIGETPPTKRVFNSWPRAPPPTRTGCCKARAEPEKNWRPGPSTATARARPSPSCPSTARR